MSEKIYSVVNNYDHARRLVELVTFTDYSSAVQFARACIRNRSIALPDDYGFLEVMRHKSDVNFHYGDLLFKIMPNGEEFEAKCEK
jgi:hypothetical protein